MKPVGRSTACVLFSVCLMMARPAMAVGQASVRPIIFAHGSYPNLYVMNADGSGLRRLGKGADSAPAWSPDGRKIAFVRQVGLYTRIFVVNDDGSAPTALTPRDGFYRESAPLWSADGRNVVFRREVVGYPLAPPYYQVRADGADLKQISAEEYFRCQTRWRWPGGATAFAGESGYYGFGLNGPLASYGYPVPPDGKEPALSVSTNRLAYRLQGKLYTASLQLSNTDKPEIHLDSAGARQLTDFDAAQPAWFPDGQSLVFSRANGRFSSIWRLGADGSGLTQLTHDEMEDTEPIVSPSGKRIVFRRWNRGAHIYSIQSDGTRLKQLTVGHYIEYTPKISPDGMLIAFRRLSESDDASGLYTMGVDGSDQKKLPIPDVAIQYFTWSPDSRSLVFSGRTGNLMRLYRIERDGAGLTRLTDGYDDAPVWVGQTLYFMHRAGRMIETSMMAMDGSGRIQRAPDAYTRIVPVFSPDGKRVVFQRYEPGHPEPVHLFLMNSDGTGLTQLTKEEYSDSDPTWSPDGTSIVFVRNNKVTSSLCLLRLDNGMVVPIRESDGQDDSPSWY